MAHVPRPLARKLDRLARRAHRFHRYAHHPLCVEYAPEVIRLGRRTRVCRGCALSIGGGALGVGSALVAFEVLQVAGGQDSIARVCGAALVLSIACGVLAWSALRPATLEQRTRARTRKLATRFLPALALGFACAFGVRAGDAIGFGLVACDLAAAGLLYTRYRRRGPDRGPCMTCPERTGVQPCRGFAPIVARERAFVRSSRRLLALY